LRPKPDCGMVYLVQRWLCSRTAGTRTTAVTSPTPPAEVAVCQVCHQQNLSGGISPVGNLSAPRLAGQSYEYLVEAMRRFAEGERTNNAEMTQVMATISSAEREAIARYIAGL
jgi:cytochrome c553